MTFLARCWMIENWSRQVICPPDARIRDTRMHGLFPQGGTRKERSCVPTVSPSTFKFLVMARPCQPGQSIPVSAPYHCHRISPSKPRLPLLSLLGLLQSTLPYEGTLFAVQVAFASGLVHLYLLRRALVRIPCDVRVGKSEPHPQRPDAAALGPPCKIYRLRPR